MAGLRLIVSMEYDEPLTDEFIQEFTNFMLAGRADEGCLRFDVTRSIEDPSKLILVELWESPDLLVKHWDILQARREQYPKAQAFRPKNVILEKYDYQRYQFDGRNYTPIEG